MISISCKQCKNPAVYASKKYPNKYFCQNHIKPYEEDLNYSFLPFSDYNNLICQCKRELINKR